MPPFPPRRPVRPGARPGVLWIIPILLALVLLDGLIPRSHHHHHASPVQAGRQAGFQSEAVADTAQAASAAPHTATPLVQVSLGPKTRSRRLPPSFLGLSIESWSVPGLTSDPAAFDRILNLLGVPGDNGLMLRVGGQSTEETYWNAPTLGTKLVAYRPGAQWLSSLAAMTSATRVRLLLDLNLIAHSPAMAASFAKAAAAGLPAGSIAGFEVGNEPDIGHRDTANPLAPAGTPVPRTPYGWDQYTSAQYRSLFRAYGRAVHHATPAIPLSGPEIFFPGRDLSWLQQLVAAQRSRLNMLTVHRYPLSSCANPAWHDYATVTRLLGSGATTGLASSLIPAVHVAQRSGLPLRLTELNSVTCGGRKGVSDTFATSLWAADALFSMWNVGLGGVNIHLQPSAPNAAFSVSAAGLVVHPLLYGLILFARTLGPGAQLLPVSTSGASTANVKVWAVHSAPHLLKVLVLDKGAGSVSVGLHLGSHGAASVQRLSAAAPTSTRATLDGQHLGAQGQWLGRRVIGQVNPGLHGVYTVPVPAYSAALVTIRR